MAALHGDMALYDGSLFRRTDHWERAMADVTREIGRRTKRGQTTRQTSEEGDKKTAVGIAVEYMTLGTLSKLYNNTRDRNVTEWVADGMNASTNELRSWLRTIADVRNVRAHLNPYILLRQIPSTPLPIIGCELDNRNPFYIFPLIDVLLGSKETSSMKDRNLDYSARMLADMAAETTGFVRLYIGTAFALKVPRRFIDPSVTSWAGTAPKKYSPLESLGIEQRSLD